MRDFKNIDRLFQENLKDFEVSPPKKIWTGIEKQLTNKSKKRLIPIWAKISSVAALLILFFSVGSIYFIPQNNFTKTLLSKRNNLINNTVSEKDSASNNIATTNKSQVNKEVLKGKVIPLNPLEQNSVDNQISKQLQENTIAENNTLKNKTIDFSLIDNENISFEDNSKTDIIPKFNKNKFTVATIFAPIYFNSFGNASGADAQFNSNQTTGKASYTYGVKFAYQLNNKFSLQSGVNLINLGHVTNNVYLTPGVAVVSLSNISNIPLSARNEQLSKESLDLANENSANLNQVFGYVEIPVELKYNVAEGKVGINLVGGFSTLLLNRDEVFIETNSFSQSLGNSNNLRSINFSGNFGVDVDYSIYKNIYINVSPMFKIQTNTFNKNSNSIQSYYLGIYTGLNYKF